MLDKNTLRGGVGGGGNASGTCVVQEDLKGID